MHEHLHKILDAAVCNCKFDPRTLFSINLSTGVDLRLFGGSLNSLQGDIPFMPFNIGMKPCGEVLGLALSHMEIR